MANFAVIKDNIVVNVIDANDLETAQLVTNQTCVEVTDETKPAFIGGEYKNNLFYPKKPSDDYFWDKTSFAWIENGYVWNEENLIWEKQ